MEMKQNNPNTCLILVLPPNASVLNFRCKDRSQERIQNDIHNLENARNFDYVIINDNLADTYNEILNIKLMDFTLVIWYNLIGDKLI